MGCCQHPFCAKGDVAIMIYDIQKASVLKRISAFLFDFILFVILIVAITFGLSALLNYDAQLSAIDAGYAKYELLYPGVKFDIGMEEYNKLTAEEIEYYNTALAALGKDPDFNYAYSMTFNLSLIIGSFAILISTLVVEFIIPLILGNGQTLGKKIFGIGLVRVDCVKVSTLQLFVRAVLGKCTVETMIPVLVLIMFLFGQAGFLILLPPVILIIQIVMICATKNNLLFHDALASTVVIDVASQLIFDSPEELIEYKKQLHEAEAAKADYL